VKDGGKGEVSLEQPIGLSETMGTKLTLANRRAGIKLLFRRKSFPRLEVFKKYTIT
jgi:hypothetical protein